MLQRPIAIAAFRHGTIPFPDGSIITRLAWKQIHEPQTDSTFRLQAAQAHSSEPATNVQFMVKDSRKYASTNGWGFFQFTNGKPDTIVPAACMACHAPSKATGFVFTHYSP